MRSKIENLDVQPVKFKQRKTKKSTKNISFANMCQKMVFSYKDPKLTKLGSMKCLNPTQEEKEYLQIHFVYTDLDMSFKEISIAKRCSNITPDD